MPQHSTWNGVREMRCYGASSERFEAWAEFGGGNRWWFSGSGPEVRRWHIKARQAGATRVGYSRL
jgi:hypothetical protein